MNTDTTEQNIHDAVLRKIQAGGVHMRPRIYFIARLVLTVALLFFALVLSALLLSFIFFSIYASGQHLLLGFGMRGLQTFLALFPLPLLSVDIVVIIALQWLLQGFKLGYRVSLINVFLGVFALSALTAALIALTPLHGGLLERADRGALPLIGDLYRHVRDSHQEQGIFRGTVIAAQGSEIVIAHNDSDHDADDGTRTVSIPSERVSSIHIGDRVYIFGTSTGDRVEAYGIETLTADQ